MNITDKNFNLLWGEALASESMNHYAAEWSTSIIRGDGEKHTEDDLLAIHKLLTKIWAAAHMSVKEICELRNLTMVELSNRFCIPYRTVQNWCNGTNKCPDYVRLMILKQLNIL